jgi:hypothetical protein
MEGLWSPAYGPLAVPGSPQPRRQIMELCDLSVPNSSRAAFSTQKSFYYWFALWHLRKGQWIMVPGNVCALVVACGLIAYHSDYFLSSSWALVKQGRCMLMRDECLGRKQTSHFSNCIQHQSMRLCPDRLRKELHVKLVNTPHFWPHCLPSTEAGW